MYTTKKTIGDRLTLKKGDDEISLKVKDVQGKWVLIGIEAPQSYQIIKSRGARNGEDERSDEPGVGS